MKAKTQGLQRPAAGRSLPPHRHAAAWPLRPCQPCRASAREFIEDLSAVKGSMRFIVVGEGAILETVQVVSSMGPVKYTEIPKKGVLATMRWVEP